MKKFKYTDITTNRQAEASAYEVSDFTIIASPSKPVITQADGTLHPSLLPPVAVGKAATVVITRKANEEILRGQLVRASSPNYVEIADPTMDLDSANVLGIALTDVVQHDDVEIQILGIMTDALFNIFGPNDPLFLDEDGGITNVKPTVPGKNYLTDIGKSLGGGDILVLIQKPVALGV